MSDIPGLTYPHFPDAQLEATFKNVIDNLFYVRRIIEAIPAGNNLLTRQQIQQLVSQIINSTTINVTSNPVVVTTHAIRLTTTPTLGALVFEYDRMSLYVGSDSTGSIIWTWTAGNMIAAAASRPTDLGTADKGFIFTASDTDQETQNVWTGTEFVTTGGFYQEIIDALTAAVVTVQTLQHTTTAAGANGMGASQVMRLRNAAATLTMKTALVQSAEWTDATDTSEDSLYRIWLMVAGTLTDIFQLVATTLTILGNYVWKSGTAFTGTLDHANTGNRTYTLADADGNIVYETAALTDNNFLFGGGGAKAKDSTFSIVPVASGGTGAGNAAGARGNLSAAAIQVVGGDGAGTYTVFGPTTNGSITITSEGTISAFTAPT